MKDILSRFFENEKIEYYAALPYSALKVTRPYLTERVGLDPKTAVLFLIPYCFRKGKNLSSYAVARDYHLYIKGVTERLSKKLSAAYPEYKYLGFGDHSPIDERYAALSAGLGILGENGLVINEKYGSYVFIAELITDAPPELLSAVQPSPYKRCDGCGACISACPTGCLSGEGKCLSDITQKKGELTDSESALMRRVGTAWGCDECQTACPYNLRAEATPIGFFKEELIDELTEERLVAMSEEEFKERAYSWRGKGTVLRNLEILKSKPI
jgi:epoxyqueuosine reductase